MPNIAKILIYSLLFAILCPGSGISSHAQISYDLKSSSANYTPCLNNSTSISAALQPDRLHWEIDGFHDSEGRRVYFRGVNIAGNSKLPPFMPFEDPRWWDLLGSWGFNVARLTVFWEAIEPEPGIYNRTYLDRLREMAEQASDRGIYLIIDMHQDMYSRQLGGDGAPAWAVPKEIKGNHSFSGRFWFLAYLLSDEVRAANAHFFQSDDLREHYAKAMAETASSLNGNQHVLGYDIMNEPSDGNLQNDAGLFENSYLKPFYLEVLGEIRKADPDAVGFIEPSVLDMYSSKLTPFETRGLVYAPHLYSSVSQNPLFGRGSQDPGFGTLLMNHEEKARELGMPLFIGEFGTPWTIKPPEQRDVLVDLALDAMEMKFVDNAYWDYSVRDVDIWNGEDFSLIGRDGQPRGLNVNVRPYLRRLKGRPLNQSFDRASKVYRLSFMSDPDAPPAVIYIPERIQYPGGFQVRASDGDSEYNPESGELWYSPRIDGCHNITIMPGKKGDQPGMALQ